MLQDYKLGIRMLRKYPGLTVAGGLALTLAIAIGAGWYDVSRDMFRPTIPLLDGDRIVEIEMRDARVSGDERRLLHDFVTWRRDLRSIVDLGVYRTIERHLILGDMSPEPVLVAETTASAFRLARVPPLVGRPLIEADEQPGAPGVVVIGYYVWQRWFGGRADAVGRTLRLGKATMTVVGVMPEGFAFPVNHRLWVPLQLRASEYAPLEGAAVRVFGRVASGATQAQANAEVTALVQRTAAASPRTHEHLRPRVLAYGGESPGDRRFVELAVTHGPILLVLIVACVNVGTLIYARTATRDGEIAMRYAIGASRARIVGQLFIEALVLASLAAVVGLPTAHWAVTWGVGMYYSGYAGGPPFWIDPGLTLTTVIYTIGLAIAGAAILGVLPAIKATGSNVQARLRNLGSGGSTLRFGTVWTTAMIAQVALTVICLPPAMGIASEALRDRRIRSEFPAHEYLGVRLALDRDVAAAESEAAFTERRTQVLEELKRQVAKEPGVVAVTFADRLPGMAAAVRRSQMDTSPGAALIDVGSLWTATVDPSFFDVFDKPIVAGRGFHEGDFPAGARTVIVNEAFARRFTNGESPIGRRLRYASDDPSAPEPWLEVVGMARDIGMTPTDFGEAPYMFHAARAGSVNRTVMGVRIDDPAAFAPRLRAIASALDQNLRLEEVRPLDDWAWRVDTPGVIVAGALAFVVGLGLFLSAAGIFSLMSVTVAWRTREIGLRSALGARPSQIVAAVFSRAAMLVGGGIAAGNLVLLLLVALDGEVPLSFVTNALATTSAIMLTVGLLACVEPARRALRIHPIDALKEM
jgi:putative ABC transport system permease protein